MELQSMRGPPAASAGASGGGPVDPPLCNHAYGATAPAGGAAPTALIPELVDERLSYPNGGGAGVCVEDKPIGMNKHASSGVGSSGRNGGVCSSACSAHALPPVEVRYSHMRYTVYATRPRPAPTNVLMGFVEGITALPRALYRRVVGQREDPRQKVPVHALAGVSGVLQPGTATLIIGSPGSGTSTFLRLISGRSHPQHPTSLLYNGAMCRDLERQGVSLRKLSSYCPEWDDHEPLQTVKETFTFAYNAITPPAARQAAEAHAAAAAAAGPGPGPAPAMDKASVEESKAEPATAAATTSSITACSCLPLTPDQLVDFLGLREAANTVVGSTMVRGISGGQKRRCTIGEALISNGRILAMDSITDGLDAATAYTIVSQLCERSRASGGIMIAALKQPEPRVFTLFDQLVLLADGYELYHGPPQALEGYLASVGYYRPSYMDIADYASEVVGDPAAAAELGLEDQRQSSRTDSTTAPSAEVIVIGAAAGSAAVSGEQAAAAKDEEASSQAGGELVQPWLLTVPALAAHWQHGAALQSMMGPGWSPVPAPEPVVKGRRASALAAAAAPPLLPPPPAPTAVPATPDVNSGLFSSLPLTGGVILGSTYAKQQYSLQHSVSAMQQTWLLFKRQLRLISRNRNLLVARLLNSSIVGAILATLFINATVDSFQVRFGLALYTAIFIGFTNNAEVPAALQSRPVVYRQMAAGAYTAWPYIWNLILASIPTAIVADLVYSSLVYWPTGWAPSAARFFFFALTIFLVDMFMASFLRLQAFLWPTQETSSATGTVFISVWLLFAGFYVIRSGMPQWLAWIVWVSPFFWAVTALGNNEFRAPRYATPVPGAPPGTTLGQTYMAQFEYPYSLMAQWGGILFLAGGWLLLGWILTPLILQSVRHDVRPGASRLLEAPAAATAATTTPGTAAPTAGAPAAGVAVPVAAAAAAAAAAPGPGPAPASQPRSSIPVTPVTIAWEDLTYDVPLPASAGGGTRRLLQGISGYAKPGMLLALMGATGAGKTTLLDVLAFRKTAGTQTGTIRLNGQPVTGATLARTVAFAEQEDVTYLLTTVEDELNFSCRLRYGEGLTTARRREFVARILQLLELTPLRNRQVGTLSRGERKRLTIGIELASNPPLLMLDEPTTGLPSRSAASIMRVLRRIVSTGQRTCVVTVHQPSPHIFFGFTHLLLLGPGGYQIYFGPLGHHAVKLVQYLQGIPGVPPLPLKTNPASWMLEVIKPQQQAEGAAAATGAAAGGAGAGAGAGGGARARVPSSPQATMYAGDAMMETELLERAEEVDGRGHVSDVARRSSGRPSEAGVAISLAQLLAVGQSLPAPMAVAAHGVEAEAEAETYPQEEAGYVGPRERAASSSGSRVSASGRGLRQSDQAATTDAAARPPSAASSAGTHGLHDAQSLPTPPRGPADFAAWYFASGLAARMRRDLQLLMGRAPETAAATAPLQPTQQPPQLAGPSRGRAVTAAVPPVETVSATAVTSLQPEHGADAGADASAGADVLAKQQPPQVVVPSSTSVTTAAGAGAGAGAAGGAAAAAGAAGMQPLSYKHATATHGAAQFALVFGRAHRDYWRNTELFNARIFQILFLGVLFPIVLINSDFNTFQGTQSLLGFLLSLSAFGAIPFFASGSNLQMERRPVFYRERAARFYHAPYYALSALLVEVPYVAVIILIYTAIAYNIAGLAAGAGPFFFFYLATFVLALFFASVSITYTALMPNLPVAQIAGGLTLSLSFLFAGLFIPSAQIPAGWKGMYYAVPTSHTLRALGISQTWCVGGAAAGCPQISVVGATGQAQSIDRFLFVQQYLNKFTESRYQWGEVGWAALAAAVMAIIGAAALQLVNWQRR